METTKIVSSMQQSIKPIRLRTRRGRVSN